MVKIKLVGAKRFMNKKASTHVIVQGDEIEVADTLAASLLGASRVDTLGNVLPIFKEVDSKKPVKPKATKKVEPEEALAEEPVKPAPEKPAPKKRAPRKKVARTRN